MLTERSFVLFVLIGVLCFHNVTSQFPAYFFSQSSSNLPPNCVCRQGGTTISNNPSLLSNANLNNQFPNNQFPNNQFPNNQMPNNQFPNGPIINSPTAINDFSVDRRPQINANQPGFSRPGTSDRRPGRRHFSSTGFPASLRICGSDGNTYSDVCLIINAQYNSPTLGGRPCDLQSAVQTAQQQQQQQQQNSNVNSFTAVCMNDGSTVQSATAALQLMLNNARLGIRCQGSCPCTLSCPPTIGNTQTDWHHGDCFNHWSFYQGNRRPQSNQSNGRPSNGRPFRG